MPVNFCSIASGSNGNCVFVSSSDTRILIDSGLSGIKIEQGLNSLGINPNYIDAIFITHEHSDHTSGAGILSRRFDIPIYATYNTWKHMEDFLGRLKHRNRRFVYIEENCNINDLIVRPFAIPHDAAEPVGYSVYFNDTKISVATDVGHVTNTIRENLFDSDLILIESNHDLHKLETGSYPLSLKARVKGDRGHLSNVTCGELICDIISEKLKHVILGHLSEENNTPELAFNTVNEIMTSNDIDVGETVFLRVAKRGMVSLPVKLY